MATFTIYAESTVQQVEAANVTPLGDVIALTDAAEKFVAIVPIAKLRCLVRDNAVQDGGGAPMVG
jgi:hypothetical protein